MEPETNVNPYAPTVLDSSTTVIESLPTVPRLVTTCSVVFNTIVMVMVSGGLFGVTVVGFSLLSVLFMLSGSEIPEFFASMFMGAGLAFVFGALFAAFAALPVVPACAWISVWRAPSGGPWTPRSIRLFGSCAGGLSGFACLAVPGLLAGESESLLFALLPAVFAAISVPLLLHRFARRCQIALDQQASDEHIESTLHPLSPGNSASPFLPPVDSPPSELT
ncbi:hypothetical protein [Novipirellula artificiosorum]|uniref:Uncharacterized protein n=1 Tax=Novipirellula artificiosorum TaxID=2528016 RepID=A0A5C6DJY1_9BACT|nr:hypothetical protein [Novipirellula artificiosorum]TWU35901.1 hypothetical protein Poly41_36520 [Novipirellula artificiosorum]